MSDTPRLLVTDREAALYKGIAELKHDLAAAKEGLQFVERWANHHGVKPCVKPEHALATIQHYPPILAITRSYGDGKVPETRNPWAELEAANARIEALEADSARYRWLRDNKHLDLFWSVSGPEAKPDNIDSDIDEAIAEERAALGEK